MATIIQQEEWCLHKQNELGLYYTFIESSMFFFQIVTRW